MALQAMRIDREPKASRRTGMVNVDPFSEGAKPMNFLLIGRFHEHVEDQHRAAVQANFNEHLMQMHPKVKLAGPLKDDDGRWVGHVIIVEADSVEQARHYAERSPYHEAGLYEHFDVTRFDIAAGTLG